VKGTERRLGTPTVGHAKQLAAFRAVEVLSVFTERRFATFDAVSLPFATWYRRTERSFALFRASRWSVALGTLANAASVGATRSRR
jgi:hypothetical protein